MEVVVIRLPGDKEGETIVDPLLATEAVARSRGRAFLDEYSTYKQIETFEIVYRDGIRLGQLVEIVDGNQGLPWKGKIIGIEHFVAGADDPGLFTKIEIERRIEV